mgnify:CR=1 FL=1|jgi:hypothetical protein
MVPSDANSLGGRARWWVESLRGVGAEGAGEGNSPDLPPFPSLFSFVLFLPSLPPSFLLLI